MVQYTEETIRSEIKINKVDYTIPCPFEEGHVCTANEAKALNQLLKENVRNNFASRIKPDAPIPSQEEFDAYVAGYEFGIRSITSTDPVMKEMIKLAEGLVMKSLTKAGVTKKALGTDNFNKKVDEILANPEIEAKIRARAEQIIEIKAQAMDL